MLENRWNTTFVRAFAAALDEIEASDSVNALVTRSSDPKFFSNGLDLEWRASDGDHPGGDRDAFGAEFMGLMGRVITLPILRFALAGCIRCWFHARPVPRRSLNARGPRFPLRQRGRHWNGHSRPRDGTFQAQASIEYVLQNSSVSPSLEWRRGRGSWDC